MITFNFIQTRGIYFQKEKETAIDHFYECIGSLRKSFDEKYVKVLVDMSKKDFKDKYQLTSNTTRTADLARELMEYKQLRTHDMPLCF